MFQMVSDKPFSTCIKNVITRFDMGFPPLLPFVAKCFDETNRKKELSFCSMKIRNSDTRRQSARFFHILANSLVILIFNNGVFFFSYSL